MGSNGGLGQTFEHAKDWVKMDVQSWGDPIKKIKDSGKKIGDIKSAFSPGKKVDGAAGAVSQVAQLERNIQGGKDSGVVDSQTYTELLNQLHTGQSQAGGDLTSYEAMVPQIGAIQDRLDVIAAGSDTTVNDRQRLNYSLLNLKDRPGRSGLIMGG